MIHYVKDLEKWHFLTKGLKIILIDRRLEEPKIRSFHYEGGIKEYVSYLNKQKDALYEMLFIVRDREMIFMLKLQCSTTALIKKELTAL